MRIYFTIAGTKHHHGSGFMEPDMRVTLEKEPEKGFDYRKITITGLGDYSKNDDNCT